MDFYAHWLRIEDRFRVLIRTLLPGRSYRNIEEYLDAYEFGLVLPSDMILPHPGEALRAAGIAPISPQDFLSSHPDWPQLAAGDRVTKPVAETLYAATGIPVQFWLNLQEAHDAAQR